MTADTYSNTLGYLVMGTGNDNNTWGGNANTAVFQIFEDAIANALTSSVTGGTLDLSGSPPPAASSQTRYAALIFSGVLGSAQSVKVPNLSKFWFIQNATSGAFALTLTTPAGPASTAIPQNSGWQVVFCDGANNLVVHPFNTKQIRMPDGGGTSPEYSNINEPSSGWRRAGTQDWRLMINGLDVFQVTGAGASSPSVVNALSPNVLQQAGAQIIPAGAEQTGAFIELPVGGWLWSDGTAYSRATYATLFGAITKATTGDTHTTTTIDNIPVDLRGKGLEGAYIEGIGITTGTTIVSIAVSSLVLSQAATGTAPGVSIRILPWGQGDGSTTFNVPDRRYRTMVGRDNMNNNPAGRSSTFAGTKLSTAGGEESHTLTEAETPVITKTPTGTAPIFSAGHANGQGANNETIMFPGGTTALTMNAISWGGGGSHNNMQPFGIVNVIIKT